MWWRDRREVIAKDGGKGGVNGRRETGRCTARKSFKAERLEDIEFPSGSDMVIWRVRGWDVWRLADVR